MQAKLKLLVLGGGTAGWMTAALLNHHMDKQLFSVCLVESPDIGIIGVGEGSTPQLRTFFATLGIEEITWMKACNATYKNGIRFNQWTKGFSKNSYFHPFPSPTDRQTAGEFLVNCHQRQQGQTLHCDPDSYFLTAQLSEAGKGPLVAPGNPPLPLNYAYHFDSHLLGQFIRDLAVTRGVEHIQGTVAKVECEPNPAIHAIQLEDGQRLKADYFFDCSGFRSLLSQTHLQTPFIAFDDNLFNNAAVAIPTPVATAPLAQTQATALDCGWAWHIPLRNRAGNGYVYSRDFCSADEAETELRTHLGLLDSEVQAKHLQMKVGRVAQTWVGNCVAVGLSQGFIEPLEATALHIVQETIEQFISAFTAGNYTAEHRTQYNQIINARIDGIRDYIVCHYQVSNRVDTEYWRANTSNTTRSASLEQLLHVWRQGGDLTAEINRQNIAQYYPAISWYCLLAGYHHFSKALSSETATQPNEAISAHIARLVGVFSDHSTLITN
ncbi:tryptophan 7-halogenase [Alteromonas sp. ASW11-36]|uniref:Tryptophan 7-halogenase n=1 Tax=Alteromonas arenosi TaxID=3055817 RepID=A0ABT7SWZ1_9ALTE|nr:tryptophan halogenase family protein [Alteromonas sp. ASW11-36]MDM7860708.1 tryptophan 7-halogenase [Alteromonas sp. ASW11-36]